MAKSIIVDFRGGLNNKISGHTIGETQGQDMTNVDLALVRLEGREQLNTAEIAQGSYFYEPGNLADAVFQGRWVSIYAEDDTGTTTTPYYANATDFALWNKDLYVTFGMGHTDGQLRVFRDGAQQAETINFNSPGTSTFSTSNATSTTENLATAETLVSQVTGQTGSPAQTVTVTTANASDFNPVYQQGSYDSDRGRVAWTKNNTTYYQNPSNNHIQNATGGSAGSTVTLSVSTVSQFTPAYAPGANFSDQRAGMDNYTFNTYTRSGVTYYYAPNTYTGSALQDGAGNPIAYNNFYTRSGTGTSGGSTETPPSNASTGQGYDYKWLFLKKYTFQGGGVSSGYYWKTEETSSGTGAYGSLTIYFNNQLVRSFTGLTTNAYELGVSTAISTQARYSMRCFINNSTIGYVNSTYAGYLFGKTSLISQSTNAGVTTKIHGYYYYDTTDAWWINVYWNSQLVITPNLIGGAYYDPAAAIYTYNSNRQSQLTSGIYTYNRGASSVHQQADASSNLTTGDVITAYFYNLTNRTTASTNVNYSYSYYTNSFTTSATYTYSDRTDTIPAVASIPNTPAFTYDDARRKLYKVYASDSDVGSEDEDTARGYNWLAANRAFTLTDHGYYLRSVRQSNYLPQLSADYTQATTSESLVLSNSLNLLNTPQRLNFSIALPADHSSTNSATPLVAYKLERRDNTATVDLGYIAPESVFASSAYGTSRNTVDFAYDASNTGATSKQVSLSNLETGAAYRIKFYAYQDTFVTVGSNSPAKANTVGITFAGNSPPSITLVAQTGSPNPGGNKRFLAADFWLEKKVITGTNTSSEVDDTYAVVRCFDVFDRNGNAVNSGAITGTSDFLDIFATGLTTGGLTTGTTQTAAPTYLRFLEEANNFFFAVGTDSTPPARYGGLNVNKSDSFLFVSEYNNPRNWPTEGYVEFESSITGLHSYPGELIVWTGSGVFRVTGSRHDQMRKSKLASTEGLPKNQERTIAQVGQYLVWVSQTGICAYNGESVVNITRGRLASLGLATGSQLHAAQFEDVYYVVDDTETGYAVDFSLQGFPISRIDLKEGSTATPANAAGQTLPPVLFYRSSVNQLFSRRGVIRGGSSRLGFHYKSREFDGGAFGSLKLVRNVTINGTGSGRAQVYLDGKPALANNVFEYDLTGHTYLKKTESTAHSTLYDFYYNGVLIRQFGGSYQSHATETGSLTEGSTWRIGEGVAPDANGPAWDVTFGGTSQYTHSVTSGNPVSMTFTYNYYAVRNNLLFGVPVIIESGTRSEPARVHLPTTNTANTLYGLPVADTWSVEINWSTGKVDWIDTEYEVLTS